MLNIHSKMSQLRINSRRPSFSLRSDSPFSTEESIFIIPKFGELKNTTLIRRAFRKEFYLKNPRQVPQFTQFQSTGTAKFMATHILTWFLNKNKEN